MGSTLILAMALGAPALKDKDVSSQLYGVWEFDETPEEARLRAVERRDGPYRWRFNLDGTWQVFNGEKEVVERRNFLLNPKAEPPTIDLNTPPTPKNSSLVLGIYSIDGDCLTICCAYPGQPRPNRFDRTPGKGDHVHRLHRVKD
jgi:uncharacterized protein (TIGR03067 family)